MATELTREDLRRLARLGATARLAELRQEEAAIRAAFPDLAISSATGRGRRGRKSGRPAASAADAGGAAASGGAAKARKRKRRKMSPAEKRAVSERMRKYWADRRKGKG